MIERDLYGGLIRLHILYHAAEEPIFGLGIIEELERHGYNLSPGTLYPILHGLEKSGYLTSSYELIGGRRRRLYAITKSGQSILISGKSKVWELFRELFEDELQADAEHARSRKLKSATLRKKSLVKRHRGKATKP